MATYCSNVRIGSDTFRSQLLEANKVLGAFAGTCQLEWENCEFVQINVCGWGEKKTKRAGS